MFSWPLVISMDCSTTDPQLLDALKNTADEAAWERFHRLYRPRILRHCRSVGLAEDRCEAVVQECFLKCFRYLPRLDYQPAVGRFRSWLNLQVNQQIAEHFRRHRRQEEGLEAYVRLLGMVAMAGEDPSQDPALFDLQLVEMALHRARLQVKPLHWQLFEAHVLQGMTSTAVAKQFGVTSVLVRVVALRVKLVLRRQWKELQDGPF